MRKYFNSSLRSLWKNSNHTLINMLGLSLGLTCSLLIFLIITYELSFDKYHPNADRIFRVVTEYTNSNLPDFSSGSTYPMAPALRADFPDPELVVFIDRNMEDPVISATHRDGTISRFKEDAVTFVDPGYFKMFKYEWLEGNTDALVKEKTVVITESMAKKYFGNESPINKALNFNSQFDATVTGVVKDPPFNTDLPFKIIFSSQLGANKRWWDEWGSTSSGLNTYVQLKSKEAKEPFESKLVGWQLKYFKGEDAENGKNLRYFLQPLKEVHFDTNFQNFGSRVVSYTSLLTLGLIGVLLLLTACINFINLNTVLIIKRAKETGIRKVMGSSRSEISFQFLVETFVITSISLIISIAFVEGALLYLNPLLDYHITFHPLSDPYSLLFILLVPFVVSVLAGLYPAVKLSRFHPIEALKNRLEDPARQGLSLRRSLIVFQLIVSQTLVVATIVVIQQLNYFMDQPLGLSPEAVVEFDAPEHKPEQIHRLVQAIKNIPGVENFTVSNSGSISEGSWNSEAEVTANGVLFKEDAQVKFTNEDFLDTYQVKLLAGQNLTPSDTANRVLINEEFVKRLGLQNNEDAIGLSMKIWGKTQPIVGVVRNFNTKSLRDKIGPTVLLAGTRYFHHAAVRLNTQNTKRTLSEIQKAWEQVYPTHVFDYHFLDDTIAKFYESERRNSYLVGIFAGIAILIGSIGLFGLVSFMASNKVKEIGIRKTLGASVSQIITMFSKEFIYLTLFSFVISAFVSYYFMEEWLSNFAYRIHPSAFTFMMGLIGTSIIVLLTIIFKSYSAAAANPVNSLRNE
jgi:putative ABC transport system permease protein